MGIGVTELSISLAVLLVVVLLIVFLVPRRSRVRRTEERWERTRQEFGAEYERTAWERGSEDEAEAELRQRRGRVERQVTPLPGEERQRYEERMTEVEPVFWRTPSPPSRWPTGRSRTCWRSATSSQTPRRATRRGSTPSPSCIPKSPTTTAGPGAPGQTLSRASRGNGGDEGGDRNETEELRQTLRRYRAVQEELARG